MLKIAVQKSERISKGFLDLLKKCGFKIDDKNSRLYYKFYELPIELYFVRGSDMPALLNGQFDVAILGQDSFLEYDLQKIAKIAKKLQFAKCHLSFAGRLQVNNFNDLTGKNIATSYKKILDDFLTKENISANIIEMNGSVESSIELGIAEIIFDIVQSGSTLLQHGLTEYFKILDLQSIMIVKNNFNNETLDKLLFRIDAVLNGEPCRYLMFNLKKSLLDKVLELLPTGKSPTILQLANPDYCAIHTLCNDTEIWQLAQNLREAGGEDILVSDINLRFL